MNPQQAENLKTLVRHMETNVTRMLDMGRYESCGTPACALGEAKAIGLIRDPMEEHSTGVALCGRLPIFSTAVFNPWHREDVTPQEWALEARKVLAENGYSMDEPKPAQTFQSFMAKALTPIPQSVMDAPGDSRMSITLYGAK